MEPLADLTTLSDDELRTLIADLKKEEDELSYKRRLLHGKIDILRAELVARLQKSVEGGEGTLSTDIDKLTEILAGKAPPPDEFEGAIPTAPSAVFRIPKPLTSAPSAAHCSCTRKPAPRRLWP